jgi:plasmid stabilization system protein ParE
VKKFSLRKLPVVATDLAYAGIWYEEQSPGAGLADALDREAEAVVGSLATDALFHRIRFRDVRRAPLRQFRFYGIYYVVRADTAIVIAVFHDRRSPERLRTRRQAVDDQL